MNEIIGAFYEAPMDPTQWSVGLSRFATFLNATGACLVFGNPNANSASVAYSVGHSSDSVKEYNAYFCTLDPLVKFAGKIATGRWMNDWRDTEGRLGRSEFYNDFMLRHNTHAAMACLLTQTGSAASSISLQRAPGMNPFDDDDQAMGQLLIEHIQRAVRLQQHMQQLEIQTEMETAALDRLNVGIIVADADGKVLFVNRQAESLCRRHVGFSIKDGRIVADGALHINHAFMNATRQSGALATGLSCQPKSLASPVQILVMPLSASCSVAAPWGRPLAFVVLYEPGKPKDNKKLLNDMFGLTAAESNVAGLLADGVPPKQVADVLMIATSTVRTHMKAIYRKTGIRRQSELSRLVTMLRLT